MKKILLFIVVFIFLYPVYPKMLPLSLDRIIQLIGAGLFFIHLLTHRKDAIRLIISRKVQIFTGVTLAFLGIVFLAMLPTRDLYFLKKIIGVFFDFFSAYLIYYLIKKIYKKPCIDYVIYYFVLAALVQTFISIYFFLSPAALDTYLSLLKESTIDGVIKRLGLFDKRFMGIGNVFFKGSTNYGISFLAVVILPYLKPNFITKNAVLYWPSVALIAIGGIMTGRTVFVAIGLGILMIGILKAQNILDFIRLNFKIIIYILLAIPVIFWIARLYIDPHRLELIANFAFEFYMNFTEGNGLQTSSTNTLKRMYSVLPESLKTWLIGDGRMDDPKGGYYMHTDVGYLRLIFYFGLPGTFLFLWLLIKYYKILASLAPLKPIKLFFLMFVMWSVILNFKGLAFESRYFVLFLVVLVLSDFTVPNFKKT